MLVKKVWNPYLKVSNLILFLGLISSCQTDPINYAQTQSEPSSLPSSVTTHIKPITEKRYFQDLSDYLTALCEYTENPDIRTKPVFTLNEVTTQSIYWNYPWNPEARGTKYFIKPKQRFFVQIRGTRGYPLYSFHGTQGVNVRYYGLKAIPDHCVKENLIPEQTLGKDEFPPLYAIVEAEQEGDFFFLARADLSRQSNSDVIKPPYINEFGEYVYDNHNYATVKVDGYIFDENHQPLADVKIDFDSNNLLFPFQAKTQTNQQGYYFLNHVPVGIQYKILAQKSGFASRTRTEVFTPHRSRMDFGTPMQEESDYGVTYNALFDAPEITWIDPARNSSGIYPKTDVLIYFSEPMNPQSVESNFGLWSKTDESLSVGKELSGILSKTGQKNLITDYDKELSLVWDISAFDVTWQDSYQILSLRFKPGKALIVDALSQNVPDYLIRFGGVGNGVLQDSGTTTRHDNYFKVTHGSHESWISFATQTDTIAPHILATFTVNPETHQDKIINIKFSETMAFMTRSGIIAGGEARMNKSQKGYGNITQSPLYEDNYQIAFVSPGVESPQDSDFVPIAKWDPIISFDPEDSSQSSVLIRLPSSVFEADSRVWLKINQSISDPAGNQLNSVNGSQIFLLENE